MHKRREPNTVPAVSWPALPSPLAHSFFREMTQRQRMLRLWTEGKNAKPKTLRISQSPSSRRVYSPGHAGPPAGQSEARIGPHRPIRGQGQDLSLWPLPLSRLGAGRPEKIPRPLSPPELWNSSAIVSVWSAEEQQVKPHPRALSGDQ